MKKVVLICDHYPVSPRLDKVRETLETQNCEVHVLAWNRSGSRTDSGQLSNNIHVYDSKAEYGNRVQKFINLLPFKFWTKRMIKEIQPHIIHAIDFEMLYIVRNLKYNLVYEIYDIKYFSNKYINKLREILEFRALQKVKLIIFASPFFNEYYKTDKKSIIINNKPRKIDIVTPAKPIIEESSDIINIGFVGVVRYFEVLEKIITIIGNNLEFNFHVYGSGPELYKIKDLIQKHNYNNVYVHGRYEIEDLKGIYLSLDYIWACYPADDYNVKLAISNKFFESLYFKKKIIVSKNTKLGSLVEREELGYVVDSTNYLDIKVMLKNIKAENSNYILKEYNLPNTNGNLWEDEENILLENYPFES